MCAGISNKKCVEMMRKYMYAMLLGQLSIYFINMLGWCNAMVEQITFCRCLASHNVGMSKKSIILAFSLSS
jgi:hypothetical protein